MATTRRAEATWSGDLIGGNGSVTAATTRVFADLPTTWKARTEEADGVTSPEELLATAHASCFSMALSHGLAQAGSPAAELKTSATVSFVPGTGITKIVLSVHGEVPGLDEEGFRAAAETAKENCPVSKALAGVPEITLEATLA